MLKVCYPFCCSVSLTLHSCRTQTAVAIRRVHVLSPSCRLASSCLAEPDLTPVEREQWITDILSGADFDNGDDPEDDEY